MTNTDTVKPSKPTHDNIQGTKSSLFYTSDTPPEQNHHWGDTIASKPERTLRVYFQNINGVQSTINWNKWRDIISEMSKNQVDIMGLVETNINWNHHQNKRALTLLRKTFKQSILLNVTSNEPSPAFHKQGGSTLALLGNVVGTISNKTIDTTWLGRWAYTVLMPKTIVK